MGLKWTTHDRLQGWWTKSCPLNNQHFFVFEEKTQMWRHVRWPLLFFNIHQHKDAIQRQPLLFWIQDQTKLSFHLTSFLLTQFRPKNIIPRGADAAGVLAGVPGAPAFQCWPAETLSVFSHVCISSRLAHPADTNCPLWLAWMKSDLQPLSDHLSPCYGCTVRKMLKHCDICYRSAESQEEH